MRIRTIKPEFWSHPVMSRQSEAAQLLAIGLLNYADDDGYFFADPAMVRNALRPRDNDYGSTTVLLRELDGIGYIHRKNHPTHGQIGFIISFADHQVINKRKPSLIKALYDYGIDTVVLPDSYRPEWKGMEGNGMEGKGTRDALVADATLSPIENDLIAEWSKYSALPKIQSIGKDRKRLISARGNDQFFRHNFPAAIKLIAESKFCCGDNDRGWKATFDWLLHPATITKIMEGKYDGKKPANTVPLREGERPKVWNPLTDEDES